MGQKYYSSQGMEEESCDVLMTTIIRPMGNLDKIVIWILEINSCLPSSEK